jgi:hypothetical protein
MGAQKFLPEAPHDSVSRPYEYFKSVEFVVEPGELTFDFGNYEPFICSLCLYHIVKKKKLSENYYFHCNDKPRIQMLKDPVRENNF